MKLTEAGLEREDLVGLRVKKYVDGQFPDGNRLGTIIGTEKKKCTIQWDAKDEVVPKPKETLDNKNVWLMMSKPEIDNFLLEKYTRPKQPQIPGDYLPSYLLTSNYHLILLYPSSFFSQIVMNHLINHNNKKNLFHQCHPHHHIHRMLMLNLLPPTVYANDLRSAA